MDDPKPSTLTVPTPIVAENIVDLANYIREGCRQVKLDVADSDCLLAAGIVIAGQPLAVGSKT